MARVTWSRPEVVFDLELRQEEARELLEVLVFQATGRRVYNIYKALLDAWEDADPEPEIG